MATFAGYNTDNVQAVQYITNRGFESDTANGTPANWSATTNGTFVTTNATLTVITAQHHLGAQACQVVSTVTPANQGMATPLSSTTSQITKGVVYTATVWIKGNAGSETLTLKLGSGADIATANITLTNAWAQYTVAWTPAANAYTTNSYLSIVTTSAAIRTFFVDDVFVAAGDALVPPLAAAGTAKVGVIETGIATRIVGSCYSDSDGTLTVYQSFEDPSVNSGNGHWDVVSGITDGSAAAAVTGGTPVTIDLTSIAPFAKVTFVNGSTIQTHLRLFIRTYSVGRG